MRPNPAAQTEYIRAFREIAERISRPLVDLPEQVLPIKMYVAGGAALHFYTGERISSDIDAVFSHRIILPDDLEISYADASGDVRLLYFDRQYNDSFALMHEDAREDAVPLALRGMDRRTLDVRLLSALDLAVSKISRFAEHDQQDIASLARQGLINASTLRQRAEDAAGAYIGNVNALKTSIDLACRMVKAVEKSMRTDRVSRKNMPGL